MTTLSKDEIIAWADEAGFTILNSPERTARLERFATLCRADLVAKIKVLEKELGNTVSMACANDLVEESRRFDAGWSACADELVFTIKERDALRAENERLAVKLSHTQLDCQTEAATVVALRAENERLASLAKEYRDNGDRLLDVTDSLRAELSALRAGSGEPVAWLKEWDSVGRAQTGLRRVDLKPECEPWLANMFPKVTPLYAHPQPNAVPVVRELVEALEHIQRCIGFGTATLHQGSATWCQSDDAITNGQQWLKECGE